MRVLIGIYEGLATWLWGRRFVLDDVDGMLVFYDETVTVMWDGWPHETMTVDCLWELYGGDVPARVQFNGYSAWRRDREMRRMMEVGDDFKKAS